MTSPYYNNIDIPYMVEEDSMKYNNKSMGEVGMRSIRDTSNLGIEYIMEDKNSGGYVCIAKCDHREDSGLIKEWRIEGSSCDDLYGCMKEDNIVKVLNEEMEGRGECLCMGEEFEAYVDCMTDWVIWYKGRNSGKDE